MMGCYILDDDHRPLPVDTIRWAHWYDRVENRRVAFTTLEGVSVSTVFLGLDHSHHCGRPGRHRAILFETMVFGGPHDQHMDRYATWDEAVAGHERIVKMVSEPVPGAAEP